MNATIRDVAEATGVSPSTVSRAFSRPEKVDDATRDRILVAAEQLGYQPNRAARSLITGRTGNIGLIVPDIDNPFFAGIVKGAQAEARSLDYPVLLVDTDEDPVTELRLARTLSRQVDGVVICASRLADHDLLDVQRLCPVVLVNRCAPGLPAVTLDNVGGMRKAVAHLRALKHQRVGYVAGPGNSYSNLERQTALENELAEAGLDYVPVGAFPPSFDGGRTAAESVLLAGVTAVVVYNDLMAIGLISRLTSFGVDVPGELSVIGVDDVPFAAMFTPALTTVQIPRGEAGRAAVSHLHELLSTEPHLVAAPPLLPTELVVRATTARARPIERP